VCLARDSPPFLTFTYKFLNIHKTVAKIKELYYGIIKQDVHWVIKQCHICAMTAPLEAKAFVIPIIAKVLLEHI
jgi:hypothetical protein